ncbi:Hydroxylysine kinase [Oopsacas minuta]|uniref:Hydroxylysine kinase n=1 Tax=Oopsacas minuta TaxID=111878 RepID=A0AAV7JTH2_9METZ|nr:Hydroxylysine kinase [Oopsacas minuta]
MASSNTIQSETAIRADIPLTEARRLFSDLYDMPNIIKMYELPSYSDRNFYVCVEPNTEYVLKIMSKIDSNLPYMQAIANLLLLVDSNNLPYKCSKPNISKNGNTVEMVSLSTDANSNGKHCVILLTYLPGKLLKDVYTGNTIDLTLLYQCGKDLAQFLTILKDYYDPGLEFRKGYIWDTVNLKMVGKYIPKIKDFIDPKDLELLEKYYGYFIEKIEPNLDKFHKCTIHSDLNEMNLLVNSDGKLIGIIDFTDTVYSYRIFELSNLTAYIMVHCYSEGSDPFQVGRHLIQGFLTKLQLSKSELDNLFTALTGRLILSAVMGYYYHSQEPTNDYLLNTPKPAINLLRHISEHEHSAIEEILFKPL